jgi:hypothetical protein
MRARTGPRQGTGPPDPPYTTQVVTAKHSSGEVDVTGSVSYSTTSVQAESDGTLTEVLKDGIVLTKMMGPINGEDPKWVRPPARTILQRTCWENPHDRWTHQICTPHRAHRAQEACPCC